jgi:predicted transcriptional regulator
MLRCVANVCVMCGKHMRCLYDLKIHLTTHTRERQFKCGDCQCSFTRRDSLKRHCLRTHRMQPQEYEAKYAAQNTTTSAAAAEDE